MKDDDWVVTCTAIYDDQKEWTDKRNGNIKWIDVETHETFVVYRGPQIECKRYVASFKGLKVHEGKLVRSSSLTIGPRQHWDEAMEWYDE
jgi:hypothetical protein